MRSSFTAVLIFGVLMASYSSQVTAQTYSSCNPLKQGSCPADPALGTSSSISFASGASNQFTTSGTVTYSSNGAGFSVAKQGDSPTITSKFYIMFGHVEFVVQAAPGQGIVSSAIMQSDCLDEIDWEWLGGDDTQVQTNYFGKGITTSYTRGGFSPAAGNHDGFHTYAIDWTPQQIVWSIDGTTVRVLTAAAAESGQYPQTPMQIKVGVWAGGDPTNPQGTITWAGGLTNYAGGPYTMYLKSINVADYSTGSSYSYSGTSGDWTSIKSNGGTIDATNSPGAYSADTTTPTTTSAASSGASSGTALHYGNDSTSQSKTGYPWVVSQSATSQSATSQSTASTSIAVPNTVSSSIASIVTISRPTSSAPYVPVMANTGDAGTINTSMTRVVACFVFCLTIWFGH